MAMPKTLHEQQSMMRMIQGIASTNMVWLGARWNSSDEQWRWDDGSSMDLYTNFDSEEGIHADRIGQPRLSMLTSSGKWHRSSGTSEYINAVCQQGRDHVHSRARLHMSICMPNMQ